MANFPSPPEPVRNGGVSGARCYVRLNEATEQQQTMARGKGKSDRKAGAAGDPVLRQARQIVSAFERRLNQTLVEQGSAKNALDRVDLATRAAGILSPADQRVLVAAAQRGDLRSRDLLVTCNQRLVYQLARRQLGRGLELEDLVQEGTLGLMHAIERYEFHHKATFITYSAQWIRQAIGRAIETKGDKIQVASYMFTLRARVQQILKQLEAQQVSNPTLEQVYELANKNVQKKATREQVAQAIELLGRYFVSLDARAGREADAGTIADLIEDENSDFVGEVSRSESEQLISAQLAKLSPLHRTILVRKFGLEGHEPTANVDLVKELSAATGTKFTKGSLDGHLRKAMDELRGHLVAAGISADALGEG